MKRLLKLRLKVDLPGSTAGDAWDAPGEGVGEASEDRRLMARTGAVLFAAGGTLGVLWLFLPHSPDARELGGVVNILGSYAVAGLLLAGGERLPRALMPGVATFGTLAITASVFLSGERQSGYIMMYLWVVIYSFYFFRRREAALQLVLVAVCYTYTAAVYQSPSGAVSRWFLIVGTLAVAGLLVAALKERVAQLIARLADAARSDPLTGLLNRRGFSEVFDMEVERARRGGRSLSVVVGDLDRFKEINDRFGHHAGDEALKRVSEVFDGGRRQGDSVARVGGEEFTLIVPDTDERGAYVFAERMRARLRDAFAGHSVPLTVSFGIASFPVHGGTTEELLQAGDQALYAAKEAGRDCSVTYGAQLARAVAAAEGSNGERDEPVATLLALAESVDIRHAGTPGHSQAVGRYAETAARELGLNPDAVERVRLAGFLHDLGKVGVRDSLLRKPESLTDDEWAEMEKHAEIGARIIRNAGLDDVGHWVLAHHERPDGRGYPRGLSEGRIPLEASIVAVADAYEAMTSDRVYRAALTPEAAQAELARCAGAQFDAHVVGSFLRGLERQAAASAPPDPTRAWSRFRSGSAT